MRLQFVIVVHGPACAVDNVAQVTYGSHFTCTTHAQTHRLSGIQTLKYSFVTVLVTRITMTIVTVLVITDIYWVYFKKYNLNGDRRYSLRL